MKSCKYGEDGSSEHLVFLLLIFLLLSSSSSSLSSSLFIIAVVVVVVDLQSDRWDDGCFQNEAMTGTYTQNSVISRITLALMEDTGSVLHFPFFLPCLLTAGLGGGG